MNSGNTGSPKNDSDTIAEQTEALCNLFSTTISSLASDAAALNQIKSLAECTTHNTDEENDNPNPEISDSLAQVDAVVTSLESKVRMLQEIVAEEKQSLNDLQEVKNAAQAQHTLLEEMMQACDKAVEEEKNEVAQQQIAITKQTRTPQRPRDSLPTTSLHHEGLLQSGAKRVSVRRDSVDPREKRSSHTCCAPTIRLDRVTEEEWNNVSRTVRGRITLAVVNDALRDIQRVFEKKYAVLHHHHHSKGRTHALVPGQVELQQKFLNSHRELQVEEHGDAPWVSEQDLRQCCAFFRNGESTARAILLIIRAVRRLKQVPAKHSQVTYVCLSSME